MKVHEGGRSLAGAVVTVDCKPLPPRLPSHAPVAGGFPMAATRRGPG